MKLIQQDFKISSKIWFSIFLGSALIFTDGILSSKYNTIWVILFNIIGGSLGLSLLLYNIYNFSFVYEFKQNEILIKPLFGLLGERKKIFKDLKKIEYSISPKGSLDSINLYFAKSKVSISMFQVDLSKVKLFLLANVEDFEELVDEKQRKWI